METTFNLKDYLPAIIGVSALIISIYTTKMQIRNQTQNISIQISKNKKSEWLDEFRKEVAKLLGLAATNASNLNSVMGEANNSLLLITLYLDDKIIVHKKLDDELNLFLGYLYDYKLENISNDEFKAAINKYVDSIHALAKEIIALERAEIYKIEI